MRARSVAAGAPEMSTIAGGVASRISGHRRGTVCATCRWMQSGALAVHMQFGGMIRHVSSSRVDAMRIPILFLAAAMTLAACGTRSGPVNALEPRSASSIRIYQTRLPRCPFRDVGHVQGRRIQDVQLAAYALRANAVLMEAADAGPRTGVPYIGTAIQFLSADCRR